MWYINLFKYTEINGDDFFCFRPAIFFLGKSGTKFDKNFAYMS